MQGRGHHRMKHRISFTRHTFGSSVSYAARIHGAGGGAAFGETIAEAMDNLCHWYAHRFPPRRR